MGSPLQVHTARFLAYALRAYGLHGRAICDTPGQRLYIFTFNTTSKKTIMNRLLKFVSFFFIACLYPSIAMAEPLLGDFILQLFSLFLFVPISIFVIWLLPYAKMSSYPELTGLYIFNTFIDALVLLYCVNSGSTGSFFLFFIIPIMLIKLFMYLKKSNSIKQKH